MLFTTRDLAVMLACLSVIGAARAEEPTPKQVPKLDSFGDPLPPGALLRLGTIRFRHGGGIHAVAVSPDGKTIASGGSGRIVLWDAASGRSTAILTRSESPSGHVFDLVFSPDGNVLYAAGSTGSGHRDGLMIAWDLAKKQAKFTISDEGASAWKRAVAVSPDGKSVVVGSDDGILTFVDAKTGTPRATLRNLGYIGGLSFLKDGRVAAPLGFTNVAVFDPQTGRELTRLNTGPQTRKVIADPDGKSLWVARDGSSPFDPNPRPGSVSRWDVAGGRQVSSFEASPEMLLSLAISPDGSALAAGASRNGALLWDAATGTRHALPIGREGNMPWIQGLAFTPDGKALVMGESHGRVRVFDVATRAERFASDESSMQVVSASFSPDERQILTACTDRTVRLWDARTGKPQRTWVADDTGAVWGAKFTPDGKQVLTHGRDGTARLWDTATGKEVRRFEKSPWGARALLSPDGSLAAASATDGTTIALYETATGRKLRDCAGHISFLTGLAFSEDGRLLVSAADMHGDGGGKHFNDCSVRVWDTATGTELRKFETGRPQRVAISPDGRVACAVTTSVEDETAGRNVRPVLRFWDVVSGKELTDRLIPNARTFGFSPDGRFLIVGMPELRLIELASGRIVHTIGPAPAVATSLVFSRGGRRLLATHGDGTALVWDLTPPALTTPARKRWDELGSDDAAIAWRAAAALAGRPGEAVELLRDKLADVAKKGEVVATAKLIDDLNSDQFGVREAATQLLRRRADAEYPVLLAARASAASPEVRQRLDAAMRGVPPPWSAMTRDRLREFRALDVLERVGTPDAKRLLDAIAAGDPYSHLTRESKRALARLAARP